MASRDRDKKSSKDPRKGHDRADSQPKRALQQATSSRGPPYEVYPQIDQNFTDSPNMMAQDNATLHQFVPLPLGGSSQSFAAATQSTMQPGSQLPKHSGGNTYDASQAAMTGIHSHHDNLRRDSKVSTQAVTGSPRHSRNASRELDQIMLTQQEAQYRGNLPAPDTFNRLQLLDNTGSPWTQWAAGNRGPAVSPDQNQVLSFPGTQTDFSINAPQTSYTFNDRHQPPADPSGLPFAPPNYQSQPYPRQLDCDQDGEDGEYDEREGDTPQPTPRPTPPKGKGNSKEKTKEKSKDKSKDKKHHKK